MYPVIHVMVYFPEPVQWYPHIKMIPTSTINIQQCCLHSIITLCCWYSPSAIYSKTVVFWVLKWCIFMGITISEVHGMLYKDTIMSVCSSIFKITQKISVNSSSVSLHQTLLGKFLFSLHSPTYMTLMCNSKKLLTNRKTHTESHLKWNINLMKIFF